jgi:transcriptional regulator with XRE-family HTH domain
MNQPELGMDVAKFRKAKGLTQAELAEKCELTTRTIQRIESGMVSPRSYTLKALSAALDYDFQPNLPANSTSEKKAFFRLFYLQFIDLFNLKTYTMRKITVLSLFLCLTGTSLFLFVPDSGAQESSKPPVFSSSISVGQLTQSEAIGKIKKIKRKARFHVQSLEIIESYAKNSNYNFGTYVMIAELISSFGHSTQPELEIANIVFLTNKRCDLLNEIAPLVFLNNTASTEIVKLAKEASIAHSDTEMARIREEINKLRLTAKYKTLEEAYNAQKSL